MAYRTFENFMIEKLESADMSMEDLRDRAHCIQRILTSSWGRLVPDVLSAEVVEAKIGYKNRSRREALAARLADPSNPSSYFIGYSQPEAVKLPPSIFNATSVVQVEPSHGLPMAQWLKLPLPRPHPVITDCDSVEGLYPEQNAAALAWGLEDYPEHTKAVAYIAQVDVRKQDWMNRRTFDTRRLNSMHTEVAGATIAYTQLRAETVGGVIESLERAYPEIRQFQSS